MTLGKRSGIKDVARLQSSAIFCYFTQWANKKNSWAYTTLTPMDFPKFLSTLSLTPNAKPWLGKWLSDAGNLYQISGRPSQPLNRLSREIPIHPNEERSALLTEGWKQTRTRRHNHEQCNKRMTKALSYHFGFWMHWLDLGRSTGVAEVGPLHAHDAGVHRHLSLHLRERQVTRLGD